MNNNTKTVVLQYPRSESIKHIKIDLIDVRAADSIRIYYDFDRDGWVIEQESKWSWGPNDNDVGDPHWKEAAFLQAWQFDTSPEGIYG